MSGQTTEGLIKNPVHPAPLGRPSGCSLDFFYLCSYDVNGVREFLKAPGFSETYDIDEPLARRAAAKS